MAKLWQLEQGVKNAMAADDSEAASLLQSLIDEGDYEEEGIFEYAWDAGIEVPQRFAQGVIDMVALGIEGTADFAEGITDAVGLDDLIDEGEDNAAISFARALSQGSRDLMLEQRFDENPVHKASNVLGSVGGFLGAQALGIGVPFAAATGLGQQSQMREAAKAEGKEVTGGDEALSRLLGIGLGLSERWTPKFILKGLPKTTEAKKFVDSWMPKVAHAASSAGIEGAQEALAGMGHEATARGLYNPDQQIGESLLDDLTYGSFAGFTTDLVLNALAGRKQKKFYQQEEMLRAKKAAEARRALQGADEQTQQDVLDQLPFMPQDLNEGDPVSNVMSTADTILYNLDDQTLLGTNFTSQDADGNPVNTVRDQDGNVYWEGADAASAGMLASRLNEAKVERQADVKIDLALDQSPEQYSPADRIGLRIFGKDLYLPTRQRRFDAAQVNFAGGTTDLNNFNENMSAAEAIKNGVKPKDMTVAQRINAQRIKKGLPETSKFTLTEARAALGKDFANMSDFQYTHIPKDETFTAATDENGSPIVVSNTGLTMRSRKVTPRDKPNTFERRNFENMKAAELYAKRLNKMRDREVPVRRSMLYEDGDVTEGMIESLLEEKNVDHRLYDKEVKAIAQMASGYKAKGRSVYSQDDLVSLYSALRSLPRFKNKRKLPVFGLRAYDSAQYSAARQSVLNRGADPFDKPSSVLSRAEVEEKAGPVSDYIWQNLKKDIDADQALQQQVEDMRHAERVKQAAEQRQAAREAALEPQKQAELAQRADEYKTVMDAISGMLKQYGMSNVATRIERQIKGAQNPLETEGAYFWKNNEVALAIDALKENPRYKEAATDADRKKVLGELAQDTLNHEVLHAMREADLFTEAEWNSLLNQINKRIKPDTGMTYWQWANSPDTYSDLASPERIAEEAVAEMTKDMANGSLKISGKPRSLLQRILNFLRGMVGLSTDKEFVDTMAKIRSGEIGARPTVDKDGKPIIRTYMEVARQGIGPDMLEKRAYHGSNAWFSEFKRGSIGSGESNQSYGYGIYFADTTGVASIYGENLYEVEIPDHVIDRMLVWEKPIGEQSRQVQNVAKEHGLWDEDRGQDLVQTLENTYGPEQASQILSDAGVTGVRYKDAASRSTGRQADRATRGIIGPLVDAIRNTPERQVTQNYVLFDENNVEIMERRQPGFPTREEQDNFLESRRPRDGRQNEAFFIGKAEKASSDIPYRPTIMLRQTPEVRSYHVFADRGNFTGHISKMISGFAEKQAMVGQALVRALKVDSFLDIGASEGGLAKTVGKHRPGAKVIALDPNPEMYRNFLNTPDVQNVRYVREAFLSDGWTDETGRKIKGFKTSEKFDAINEDFTFQFISPDRPAQVAEVKKMLKEDGVFITSEKFHTENSAENEQRKLAYQRQYFTPEQLTEDRQTIINGMSDDMVNDKSYEEILKRNFHWVAQFWNAGDFKGYIASDSKAKVEKMLAEIGDLSTNQTDTAQPVGDFVESRRSPEFKRWSENAPVVENAGPPAANKFKTGKPVVARVYHGSGSEFEAFRNEKLGSNTGAGSATLGHFASGTKSTAKAYTSSYSIFDDEGLGFAEWFGFAENVEYDYDDGTPYISHWTQSEPVWWQDRDSVELVAVRSSNGFMTDSDKGRLDNAIKNGAKIEEAKVRNSVGDPAPDTVYVDVADAAEGAWFQNLTAEEKAQFFEWVSWNEDFRQHQLDKEFLYGPGINRTPSIEEAGNPVNEWHAKTQLGTYKIKRDGKDYVLYFDDVVIDASPSRQKLEEVGGDHFYNAAMEIADGNSSTLYELYVRMMNPFVHDYQSTGYREKSYYDVINAAKKKGHDGVILLNTFDGGDLDNIFVFFKPNQVKSATHNSGAYSEEDSFLMSRRRVGTTGQYVGAPEGINSPQRLGGLFRRMYNLAREGADGKFWYERSAELIKGAVNDDTDDADKLIQIIAITSPSTPVGTNLTYALQAFQQWKAGNDVWTGMYPESMSAKIKDVLAGKEWEGRKTNNFYENLMSFIDPSRVGGVTTDIWMMRAFGYFQESPTDAQYTFVENEVKKLAKRISEDTGEKWEPHQVQAAMWVAMKARTQNKEVKEKTDKTSAAKGFINIKRVNGKKVRTILDEKAHTLNWLKHAFRYTPNRKDIFAAKFDYADAIRDSLAQVSWESRPGRTTGFMQESFKAPLSVLVEHHSKIMSALRDPAGRDNVAKLIGIMSPRMFEAPGVWEGRLSPGTQTQVAAPKKYTGEPFGEIDDASWDLIEAYAASLGILLKQDAVGWHRPFFRVDPKAANPKFAQQWANGVEVNLGRGLTMEEARMVNQIMSDLSGHSAYAPIGVPGGFRLIHWNNLNEGRKTTEGNREFQGYVRQLIDRLPNSMHGRAKMFHAQTGLLMNDWRRNPNGEDYIGMGRLAGRPDLQRRVLGVVRSIQPRVDAVNDEFARRYGWSTEAVYSRRPAESGDRSGRRLPNFSEQGLVLGEQVTPGAITVDGIHYGQEETDTLMADRWGTGIKGAERNRINTAEADPRLKRRVYFYAEKAITDYYREKNPYMAKVIEDGLKHNQMRGIYQHPESGLGPHVFVQRFANVLNPDSTQGREIANRSLDNNMFEVNVMDSGFDGYYIPEQGLMVILNHDVPVQYLGLKTDLKERGNDVVKNREALFPELQATGADAVFSRRGDLAKYRAKRISNIWAQHGYPDGQVKAAIAYVDPDMFVRVTTGKSESAIDMPPGMEDMADMVDGYKIIKSQTRPLDVDQMAREVQTPFLYLKKEGDRWRITDHEGRHRLSAMSDAGIKKVPVVLVFKDWGHSDYVFNESGTPETGELLPQDFSNFTMRRDDVSSQTLPYEELTDVTWENMPKIKERFGDDSSAEMAFSRRSPPGTPPAQQQGPVAYNRVIQPKSMKNKLRRFWYKQFKAQGLLPQNVFDEKVTRDAAVSAEELHIGFMNRDFEKAVKKAYQMPFNKLPQQQVEKFSRYLTGEDINLPQGVKDVLDAQRAYLDQLSTRMVETGVVTADQSIQNILDNRGKYLHRSYQVFDDPKWAENVPTEVYNNAFQYLTNQYRQAGLDHSPAHIEGIIGNILNNGAATDIPSFIRSMSQGKLGTKNLTMLIKRKDIAKPIRDLMGEYRDPRLLFARSATMMQRAVANQIFQGAVKNAGLGVFLFEKPTGAYNVSLASKGSTGMDVLANLYTTPEIAEAFVDATNPEQYSDTYRKIIAMNALVKYGKTVVAPTTMARNFVSAFFFSMANGHANVLSPQFWRNVHNSGSILATTMMSKKQRRDYVLKLKSLGVTLDNPYAGEMIGLINDSAMLPDYQKGARRKIKSTMDFFTKLYQYGDDFWKVIGFESEKAALMKHGNMSESDAEVEAAKRIRNTYPTYSLVGKGVKRLRRFPLAGTFVSFPAEIVRTAGNIVTQTAEDLSNPALRPLAMRRIVGMSVAGAWAHVAAMLSMAMMGIDDDDDEAIRKLGPPWSRNSNLMYLGYDEDGFPQFMDISYTDPYNYLKRPINALLTEGDATETLKSLAVDLGSPFLGPDIAASALGEVIFNKKLDGGRVFNPNASPDEQAKEAFLHIWGSVQPGVAGNIERMYKASRGDSSTYGKKYKMDDEISALFGLRKMTLSPLLGLGFKGFDYVDGMRNADAILKNVVSGQNIVSDAEIEQKFAEMMLSRQKVAKRFIDQIEMTQKFSGRPAVARLLSTVVPSKADLTALISGHVPDFRFTGDFMKSARERLIAMSPPHQRKEALERFQHRVDLVAKLYSEYRKRQ
jgi:SAM-dependent methyltransferase